MDLSDIIYLVSMMAADGFAFCIIAICYARIYFSLGKETRQVARNASRGEMTVAKKMALLVFTNFVSDYFNINGYSGYSYTYFLFYFSRHAGHRLRFLV